MEVSIVVVFDVVVVEIIEIETERLCLRQWRARDFPVFARLNADPGVMAYYPDVLGKQESNNLANKIQSLIAKRGWGFWSVEEKASGRFTGFTGLHVPEYELPCMPCVEIGWRLARQHWGKGYATEAGKAALDVAFNRLDLAEVVAFASVANNRSIAVMERLNMHDTKQNFIHPLIPAGSRLGEHVLYKITKEQWNET